MKNILNYYYDLDVLNIHQKENTFFGKHQRVSQYVYRYNTWFLPKDVAGAYCAVSKVYSVR